MAHTEKFKRSAAGQLGAHIDRLREDGHEYGNENIDPERTSLNYDLSGCDTPLSRCVADAIASAPRTVRKDAVLLACTVTTLPADWPEDRDPKEFFRHVRDFDLKFWPPSYVEVRARVHMDESTPHLHHVCIPLDEEGQPNWSKTYTRAMFRRYHAELAEYVREKTKLPDLRIILPEDDPRRVLSGVSQDRLDAASAALDARVADARRGVEKARRTAKLLEGESYTSVAKDGTRTKRRGVAGLRKDIAELTSQRDKADADAAESRQKAQKAAERAKQAQLLEKSAIAAKKAAVASQRAFEEALAEAEKEHAARLEGLQRQGDRREGEVVELEERAGELESVAAAVRSWEGAGAGRRAEIVDQVRVRCDGLRGRIESGCDSIRDRVRELARTARALRERLEPYIEARRQELSAQVRREERERNARERQTYGGYSLSGVLTQSAGVAAELGKHNPDTRSADPSL